MESPKSWQAGFGGGGPSDAPKGPALEYQLEQRAGATMVLARALSEYRSALIQHGFTREEALVLVGRYQDSFIGNLKWKQ